MESIFRTYKHLDASAFDLISGSTETKQTLGLAYLLSQDSGVLKAFLKLPEIKRVLGSIRLSTFSKVIVHSELISETKKRADIVIQLYRNEKPEFAIIIEAKSANKKINGSAVITQLEGYLNSNEFPELNDFKKVGCTLTKNDVIIKHPYITALSWHRIFEMLNNKGSLAIAYLNFITKIKGTMKFYEKEVCSIPAGGSSQYQYDYPWIYECPNEGHQFTSLKKPLFMTFRLRGGGVMERLFSVDEIIILNPQNDFDAFLANKSYSEEVKARVKFYCDKVWSENSYDNNEKQFYILSEHNQIELPHRPRPKQNGVFRAYYKLAEILDQSKIIISSKS